MPSSLVMVVILMVAVVLHEWAHAVVADRHGDPTPRAMGRLTVNPMAHIDWVGTVLVPLVSVLVMGTVWLAWAKPVPVNPRYFSNPDRVMMRVALAGPIMNLTLALGARFVMMGTGHDWNGVLSSWILINVGLMVFNLLPIPPLDGSRVIRPFLPMSAQSFLDRLDPYGLGILLILAMMGVLNGVVWGMMRFVLQLLGL